jgi:hypothetical protein
MSYRDPCRHCGKEILVARIRGGRWLPFDLQTISATPDAVDAWVAVRRRGFVPIGEIADHRLASVTRYARQHRCPEFLRWLADRKSHVGGFSESLGALVDLWTKEPS